MKEYIDAIRCRYDYILIDCMPSLGMMTINALVSSDSVLIPVQAAYLPVKGLQQLIKTILTVKKRLNRKLAIEGILLTMVDFRTNYARDIASRVQGYENLVKETIDYESLEITHHDDMRQVDEIVNLIVETVMCKNDKILIASNWYPASLVKKKFLMLTYSHIEYVLHCMSGNTTKVKNIKKYLLAALFNAPSTMNGYYQAEVNHDMPGLVR